MLVKTFSADQLDISPFNVRKNYKSAHAVEGMAKSLLESGQLYPLVVHPMLGSKKFGALAGGRRLRAFKLLIKDGRLPANHPIEAIVREGMTNGELIDFSLQENLQRVDLYPYEVYAACARSHRAGRTIQEIAGVNGQEVRTVAQWIRLGNLHPDIFKALEEERISSRQAEAFAAVEDPRIQLAAWTSWQAAPEGAHYRDADAIRRILGIGDRELGRLLAYVGEAAYRDAGGRYELDLFADDADARGLIHDQGILRELAEAKLDRLRARIRARADRADMRFSPAPPSSGNHSDYSLEIPIDFEPEGDAPVVLPAGYVIATVRIDDAGKPLVRFWWESRRAQAAATAQPKVAKKSAPAPSAPSRPREIDDRPIVDGAAVSRPGASIDFTARERADRRLKDAYGLTQEGVQAMRTLRRDLLRTRLLEDAETGGRVAIDALVWGQLRMMLTQACSAEIGMRPVLYPDRDDSIGAELLESMTAGTFAEAIEDLQRWPAFTLPSLPEAFAAYRQLHADDKDAAATILGCLVLERSLEADGYRVPMHNAIAAATGRDTGDDIRGYAFTPTAPFFNLFGKDHRLQLVQPFVSRTALAMMAKSKNAEQIAAVSRVFTAASPELLPEKSSEATTWLHDLLAFTPPVVDDAVELREAAE